VQRFQPNGPQFRSLCYVDVAVSPKNEIQWITLGLKRAFIRGADEPFARDLVRSFLCLVFPHERPETVGQFVDELGTEFGGSRPVIVGEGVRRPAPGAKPSPFYLVFLGQGKRCATRSGAFLLEAENVSEGSTPWLCVRVKPPSA
jgi:hypothetical protein